ncbi:MAG TPA: hypothetical protein VIC53_04925, partial [Wenzhouxiangella sp.]
THLNPVVQGHCPAAAQVEDVFSLFLHVGFKSVPLCGWFNQLNGCLTHASLHSGAFEASR